MARLAHTSDFGLQNKYGWCPEAESNHRHEDFQSSALPTELSGLIGRVLKFTFEKSADQNEARIKATRVAGVKLESSRFSAKH